MTCGDREMGEGRWPSQGARGSAAQRRPQYAAVRRPGSKAGPGCRCRPWIAAVLPPLQPASARRAAAPPAAPSACGAPAAAPRRAAAAPRRPGPTCADACRILIRSSCISVTTWSRIFSGSSAAETGVGGCGAGCVGDGRAGGVPAWPGCGWAGPANRPKHRRGPAAAPHGAPSGRGRLLTYLVGVALEHAGDAREEVGLHHDSAAAARAGAVHGGDGHAARCGARIGGAAGRCALGRGARSDSLRACCDRGRASCMRGQRGPTHPQGAQRPAGPAGRHRASEMQA
jgi:hypothetical protein